MAENQLFMLGDIPQGILEEATRSLAAYSTAIGWIGCHVGGGTFVRVNGRSGILTARHVWDAIYQSRRKHPEVNLLVANGAHSFPIRVDYLTPRIQLDRNSDAWGPDIEFIELPSAAVGQVLRAKSFAEISARADRWLPVAECDEGFGAVMGFPAEQSRCTPLDGDRYLLELRGGYVSGIENSQIRGEFDYVETIADPFNAAGLPTSYGGVSGSGLWRMQLHKKTTEPIDRATLGQDYALAGVAFYQEPMKDGRMLIRYHGPKTIYRQVPKLVPPI